MFVVFGPKKRHKGIIMRNLVATQGEEGTSTILRVNSQQPNFKLGLFAEISSGANLTYTIQYTYDQPEDTYATDYATDADWRSVDAMSGVTADTVSNLYYPVNAVRINVTSYTSGSVQLTATQSM